MQNRRVFVLDDAEKTLAEKMAKHFYSDQTQTIESRNLCSDPGCIAGMQEEYQQSLVFLAHGSSNTYGGKEAQQFAELIADRYPEGKRSRLEHLYLAGCEIGLRQKDGSSMAQNIADELAKLKFTNVLVHAITQPENSEGDVLVLEVAKEGKISAWLMDKKNGERYLELDAKTKKLYRKISQAEKKELENLKKHAKEKRFVKNQDPKKQFNKMLNTFKPGESPEARQKRLQFYIDAHKLDKAQRDKAIELLQERLSELEVKKGQRSKIQSLWKSAKKIAKRNGSEELAIKYFINKLDDAELDEWRKVLASETNKSFFNNRFLGVKVNQGGTTTTLLKSLTDGASSNQSLSSSEGELVGHDHKPPSKSLFGKIGDGLEKVGGKVSGALSGRDKREDIKYQPVPMVSEEPVDNKRMENEEAAMLVIRAEITRMIDLYKGEMAWRRWFCCCFFGGQLANKGAKLDAYEDLQGKVTLENMRTAVTGYLDDAASLVMKSAKTTRARDSLNLIKNKCDEVLGVKSALVFGKTG